MQRGYIDRFEGDLAVIESDGASRAVPRCRLPEDARPGDAVELGEDGAIRLDAERTAARRREIEGLMDELFVS